MAEAAARAGSGIDGTTLGRLKGKTDRFLATTLRMNTKKRKIMYHYMGMLWEQLRAMLPITLLQASALALFLTYQSRNEGQHKHPGFGNPQDIKICLCKLTSSA